MKIAALAPRLFCGALVVLASPLAAQAQPKGVTPETKLALSTSKPAEFTCDSKAVMVATDRANATNGSFRMRVALEDAATGKGSWTPLSSDQAHVTSLAAMQAKTCASGCPMTLARDTDVQLWAPAPKSIDKLGPDELLMLAVLKLDSGQLKASTFRGQQIEALESGICRSETAPAAPAPADQTQPSEKPKP